MRLFNLVFAALLATTLAACDSDKGTSNRDSINTDTTNISNFDPSNSVIPFPNDLLFSGTLDGTLNIPVADAADLSDPQVALNALDGFSTVAPMSTGFLGAIDATSITPSSVRLFEVTLSSTPGGAVVAINSELTFGVDFVATLSSVDTTNSTLVILPLKPLKPKTSYYAVITNALMSASGKAVAPSVTYALTKGTSPLVVGGVSQVPALTDQEATDLEPLRQLVSISEATAAANASPALAAADIVLSWSFTTQSVGDVLSVARGLAGIPATTVSASTVDLGLGAGAGKSPLGAADIYEGAIDVPYYLTASTGVNDPTALSSFWKGVGGSFLTRYNPTPVATELRTIPMLISTPAVGSAPWPVVIFQHGITSDRTAMLGIADAMALAGYAVVAIDMPMHGVNSSSPFYQAGNERTFDLDLVTQDADGNITVAAPDGVTDSSGLHFINLTNLLNTRDNVRQAVVDLFALTAAIPSIDPGGGALFDGSNIRFVGHSLGAMVGTVFLALEPNVDDAVLAFGGSMLPKILDGSASFGPTISAGLAATGVIKGTPDYESFFGAAQTVVDSADPVNYSLNATGYAPSAASGRGLLFFEIVGGNSSPSDLVVPNTVPDGNDSSGTVPAPLAGTEPQLRLLGLTHVNTDQGPSASDLLLTTKFVSGDHRSLLDPTADPLVTTEMQTQAASFIGSNGLFLDVTDDTLLTAP